MKLDGKVALVTGGAKRIGREIALILAERGAKVALHYNRSEKEAKELGLPTFQADLGKAEEIDSLVKNVEKKLGPIAFLINNASIFEKIPFEKLTEKDWDRFLDINLKAPFLLAKAVAKGMLARKEGKIINIADASVRRTYPGYLPYYVSKGGLETLTVALAKELAPHVQVNALALGPILPSAHDTIEKNEKNLRTLLGRWGDPKEVAKTVCFLLETADFATGSVWNLDGGRAIV